MLYRIVSLALCMLFLFFNAAFNAPNYELSTPPQLSKYDMCYFYLDKGIFLKKANRLWSYDNRRNVAKILTMAWKKFGISPDYIVSVWMHESHMNPYAISRLNWNGTRDYGLGQINIRTLPWIYRFSFSFLKKHNLKSYYRFLYNKKLLNVCFNAVLSAIYLGALYKQYGKISAVLTAYNSGKPRPLYGVYWLYYKSVMRNYHLINEVGNDPKVSYRGFG